MYKRDVTLKYERSYIRKGVTNMIEIDGKVLKNCRENLGITRKEMSNMLGVAPTSINNYESNTNGLNLCMKNRYVETFQLSEFFLTNDNVTRNKNNLIETLKVFTLAKKIDWIGYNELKDETLKMNILKATKLLEDIEPPVKNNRIILKNYKYNLDEYIRDYNIATIGKYTFVGTSFYIKNIKGDELNSIKAENMLFEIVDNEVSLINSSINNKLVNELFTDIIYSKGLYVDFKKNYLLQETKEIIELCKQQREWFIPTLFILQGNSILN